MAELEEIDALMAERGYARAPEKDVFSTVAADQLRAYTHPEHDYDTALEQAFMQRRRIEEVADLVDEYEQHAMHRGAVV